MGGVSAAAGASSISNEGSTGAAAGSPEPGPKPLKINYNAVSRHVAGTKMVLRMPESAFEEHRAKRRAASASNSRAAAGPTFGMPRPPLPNLRGCVHAKVLPASAVYGAIRPTTAK